MPTVDYAAARRNMVNNQLRTNRIVDPMVLEAMSAVPRELFTPPHFREVAYIDEDIPIAPGRYLMEPIVFGRIIQSAQIQTTDVVADIACGSGYSAAVLALLADVVIGVECEPDLVSQSNSLLTDLEVENVVVIQNDLQKGYPNQAPYDVIIIEGGVGVLSQCLCDQLAEGGRLIAIVTQDGQIGKAILVTRVRGNYAHRTIFDANVKILPAFAPDQKFVF